MVKVSNMKRTLFSTKAHKSEFSLMFEINSSSIFSFEQTRIKLPKAHPINTKVKFMSCSSNVNKDSTSLKGTSKSINGNFILGILVLNDSRASHILDRLD